MTALVGLEDPGCYVLTDRLARIGSWPQGKLVEPAAYPLPTPTEALSNLRGGTVFSTLDLAQAYQQLRVTDTTTEMLTINTIKGLFRVKRLPFGVAAAPAIFQKVMDMTLAGIPGVAAYLDDVIISGANVEEHAYRLDQVLTRLEKAGLRLKETNCHFGVREVKFLGHLINPEGIPPTHDKIRAVVDAPEPTNKAELQSFLGLLAFYGRFLQDRVTIAKELYSLLERKAERRWKDRHRKAFQKLKQLIVQYTVLAHYDDRKPLLLSCDASPYGVGAVLAQLDSDGREAPISFASRTLGTS